MSVAALPDLQNGRIWTLGRVVLVVLALVALGLLLATPWLIKPFPQAAPWYESAAMFPRVALGVVIVSACAEFFLRRRNPKSTESDELDSSTANLPKALMIISLFVAYCFLVPILGYLSSSFMFLLVGGRIAGLSLRLALVLAGALSLVMWAVFQITLKVAFGHGWLI